jgi:hypothetical protein
LSSSRRKWFALVVIVFAIALAAIGTLVFVLPSLRTYVVIREIPVSTYQVKTETTTATLRRIVTTSSPYLSATTKEYLGGTVTGEVRLLTVTVGGTFGVLLYTTQTLTLWASYNQTLNVTTTVITTATVPSTYTRTIRTTLTAPPAGIVAKTPVVANQIEGFVLLVLCSLFIAGILILRRKPVSSRQ